MPQGIKGWAVWVGGQLALTYAFKLAIKLVDNAVIGWGDDQIAAYFGISSPSIATAFNWALPFVLAATTLWLFHYWVTRPLKEALANLSGGDRFSATGAVEESNNSTSVISQISKRLYAEVKVARRALGLRVIAAWVIIIVSVVGLIAGFAMLALGDRQTTAMAAAPNESMLSGRRVSGLEVVSRLEKLEGEHAKTVSELAATKQQLESKQQELAAVTNQSTQKPRYNDGEIREMIDVMGTLRRIVDQEIAPETWKASDLNQMWQRRLKEIGPSALASEFRSYSDPPNAAQIQINKILYDKQQYIEHIRPILEGFDAIGGFIGASRELANELDEYKDAQNVNVAKIVEGRFNRWYQATQELAQWVGKTDARITAKTKELREWN